MRGQHVECVVQANGIKLEMRLLLTVVLADVAMGVA